MLSPALRTYEFGIGRMLRCRSLSKLLLAVMVTELSRFVNAFLLPPQFPSVGRRGLQRSVDLTCGPWLGSRQTRLHCMEASFFDSIGQSLKSLAEGVQTVAGGKPGDLSAAGVLSTEESEELERKTASGEIDFDDFFKLTKVMTAEAIGEEGDRVNRKLGQYKAIIDAMSQEERANPRLLLAGEQSEESIVRIALGSGTSAETVGTFLDEFRSTRSLFMKLASGMSMRAAQQELAAETLEDQVKGKSRSKRRRVLRKGKQPEWMDL
mmetsp:Transcript_129300/g.360111  ORF Transcript_129300/g.360111 Transcript_129300/m.360111 type:complete len:266 (-) Transcript_129300:110-907(-)